MVAAGNQMPAFPEAVEVDGCCEFLIGLSPTHQVAHDLIATEVLEAIIEGPAIGAVVDQQVVGPFGVVGDVCLGISFPGSLWWTGT